MIIEQAIVEARVARLEKANAILVLVLLIAIGVAVREALEPLPPLRAGAIRLVGEDGAVVA